jgi:hypothetical protein
LASRVVFFSGLNLSFVFLHSFSIGPFWKHLSTTNSLTAFAHVLSRFGFPTLTLHNCIVIVADKAHKADINGTCATHQCWYRIPCSVFLWQSDIWPPSCTCLRASQSLALADTARVDEFMACERQVYIYTSGLLRKTYSIPRPWFSAARYPLQPCLSSFVCI